MNTATVARSREDAIRGALGHGQRHGGDQSASPALVAAAEPEEAAGAASRGPWRLAWASCAGIRHALAGKPCEDTVAHRFHVATFGATAGDNVALAVADGVSGGALGHVASFAAAAYCVNVDGVTAVLQPHMAELDNVVYDALSEHTFSAGASTLAGAWLSPEGRGWLAHVGDVRAYRFAPAEPAALDSLQPLTRDQSFVQLGELPPAGVSAHNPARMIGTGDAAVPDLQPLMLEVDEILLLASDGLHSALPERFLAVWLHRHVGHAPSLARLAASARRLVRLAIGEGSTDDVSVMLLHRGGNQ